MQTEVLERVFSLIVLALCMFALALYVEGNDGKD